jgi:hypothetical protein
MVRVLSDFDSAGKPAVLQLANFDDWTYIYLQVYGPGTVRLATDDQQLISPAPNAGAPLNGMQLTSTDGLFPLRWIGPLWAIGSAPNTLIDIQVPVRSSR